MLKLFILNEYVCPIFSQSMKAENSLKGGALLVAFTLLSEYYRTIKVTSFILWPKPLSTVLLRHFLYPTPYSAKKTSIPIFNTYVLFIKRGDFFPTVFDLKYS